MKNAVPNPVPMRDDGLEALAVPATARPCTSASLATRHGLPIAFFSAVASLKWDQASWSFMSTSVPGPFFVTKCGALRMWPRRTMPGKPAEMRSASGSFLASSVNRSTRCFGGIG